MKNKPKPKVEKKPVVTTAISHCMFNVDAFKKADMETLGVVAKALLNITEFYKGTTVEMNAPMLSIVDGEMRTEIAKKK